MPNAFRKSGPNSETPSLPAQRSNRTSYALLVILILAAIVPRWLVIFGGLETFIQFFPDDAYYYPKVAEQILAGNGSTFDGVHATNGYHPLWLLMVMAPVMVVGNEVLLTEVLMCLSTTMILVSSVFLYLSLRILLPRYVWLQFAWVAIYLFNPQILFSSVNGLETGITNMIFRAMIYVLLSRYEKIAKAFKTDLVLGVLIALLFLARTDTALFVVPVLISLILRKPGKPTLSSCMRITTVAAVITLPWLIWSYLTFGSFIQDSGTAVPFRLHQNYLLAGKTTQDLVIRSIQKFFSFMKNELAYNLGFLKYFYFLILASAYVLFSRWKRIESKDRQFLKLFMYLLAGGLGLSIIHAGVRWFPREWYFSQLILVCVILFATAMAQYARYPQGKGGVAGEDYGWQTIRRYVANILSAALIVVSVEGSHGLLKAPPYPHQNQMFRAAQWLKKNTAKEEIVASFSSGIYSFFSQRKVVNLDGVMNSAAYAAIRRRELLPFMKASGIHIYLDHHPILFNQHRLFFGSINEEVVFSKIGEIPRQGEHGWESWPVEIFRIQWPKNSNAPAP